MDLNLRKSCPAVNWQRGSIGSVDVRRSAAASSSGASVLPDVGGRRGASWIEEPMPTWSVNWSALEYKEENGTSKSTLDILERRMGITSTALSNLHELVELLLSRTLNDTSTEIADPIRQLSQKLIKNHMEAYTSISSLRSLLNDLSLNPTKLQDTITAILGVTIQPEEANRDHNRAEGSISTAQDRMNTWLENCEAATVVHNDKEEVEVMHSSDDDVNISHSPSGSDRQRYHSSPNLTAHHSLKAINENNHCGPHRIIKKKPHRMHDITLQHCSQQFGDVKEKHHSGSDTSTEENHSSDALQRQPIRHVQNRKKELRQRVNNCHKQQLSDSQSESNSGTHQGATAKRSPGLRVVQTVHSNNQSHNISSNESNSTAHYIKKLPKTYCESDSSSSSSSNDVTTPGDASRSVDSENSNNSQKVTSHKSRDGTGDDNTPARYGRRANSDRKYEPHPQQSQNTSNHNNGNDDSQGVCIKLERCDSDTKKPNRKGSSNSPVHEVRRARQLKELEEVPEVVNDLQLMESLVKKLNGKQGSNEAANLLRILQQSTKPTCLDATLLCEDQQTHVVETCKSESSSIHTVITAKTPIESPIINSVCNPCGVAYQHVCDVLPLGTLAVSPKLTSHDTLSISSSSHGRGDVDDDGYTPPVTPRSSLRRKRRSTKTSPVGKSPKSISVRSDELTPKLLAVKQSFGKKQSTNIALLVSSALSIVGCVWSERASGQATGPHRPRPPSSRPLVSPPQLVLVTAAAVLSILVLDNSNNSSSYCSLNRRHSKRRIVGARPTSPLSDLPLLVE